MTTFNRWVRVSFTDDGKEVREEFEGPDMEMSDIAELFKQPGPDIMLVGKEAHKLISQYWRGTIDG